MLARLGALGGHRALDALAVAPTARAHAREAAVQARPALLRLPRWRRLRRRAVDGAARDSSVESQAGKGAGSAGGSQLRAGRWAEHVDVFVRAAGAPRVFCIPRRPRSGSWGLRAAAVHRMRRLCPIGQPPEAPQGLVGGKSRGRSDRPLCDSVAVAAVLVDATARVAVAAVAGAAAATWRGAASTDERRSAGLRAAAAAP